VSGAEGQTGGVDTRDSNFPLLVLLQPASKAAIIPEAAMK